MPRWGGLPPSWGRWCGAWVVTVLGLPREVALGALALMLVTGRVILHKMDDRPREWGEADRNAEV